MKIRKDPDQITAEDLSAVEMREGGVSGNERMPCMVGAESTECKRGRED